jgi:hypothetical protein
MKKQVILVDRESLANALACGAPAYRILEEYQRRGATPEMIEATREAIEEIRGE